MINCCTKHLGTGHPALKISNSVQENNIEYKIHQAREIVFHRVSKHLEESYKYHV